jgi:hypothetical protein
MTTDERDAKCWRQMRKAILEQANDRWRPRDVRRMAEEMLLVMIAVETSVQGDHS